MDLRATVKRHCKRHSVCTYQLKSMYIFLPKRQHWCWCWRSVWISPKYTQDIFDKLVSIWTWGWFTWPFGDILHTTAPPELYYFGEGGIRRMVLESHPWSWVISNLNLPLSMVQVQNRLVTDWAEMHWQNLDSQGRFKTCDRCPDTLTWGSDILNWWVGDCLLTRKQILRRNLPHNHTCHSSLWWGSDTVCNVCKDRCLRFFRTHYLRPSKWKQ